MTCHIETSKDNEKLRGKFMSQEKMVATNVGFTKDTNQLVKMLYRKINELVYIINTKDSAIYNDHEFFTSQQWCVGSSQGKQQGIYRKCIEYDGPLPDNDTLSIAHNISGINNNWFFTKITAISYSPAAGLWMSLPDSDTSVFVDATNVMFETESDYSDFTKTIITLEYTKA